MGLFQHRPEDPTEWAGLPGEPLRPTTPAEQLADTPPGDVALDGAFGLGAASSISISIPIDDAPTE